VEIAAGQRLAVSGKISGLSVTPLASISSVAAA
jgi:hypothetical protein